MKEKLVGTIEKGKDEVAAFAHYVAMYIIFGKAVSNTKSNLNDAQGNDLFFNILHNCALLLHCCVIIAFLNYI